jgi:hypothetical protein
MHIKVRPKKRYLRLQAPGAREAIAMLYKPRRGSGLPQLKFVRVISRAPLSPQALFARGDPTALAKRLREGCETSEERLYIAGIVEGVVKRPRGNKRARALSLDDARMIRQLAAGAEAEGIRAKVIWQALADFYNRSVGNIRDVLERRGAYAEK